VDGIQERLHLGQPRAAVLAAWGITTAGHKVLLGLQPGTKADTTCCADFLRDLKARGLADPILPVTDGAPGLIRAVEEVLPRSLRQRCLAHKPRNLEAKVPQARWREVKAGALAAYQASSPTIAALCAEAFTKTWGNELPSASKCFEDDFEACIAHLKLPVAHRRATRTTNLLERLFLEERRRSKTIPHAFGERAVLKADVRRHSTGESDLATRGDHRLRAPATDHPARTTQPRVRCQTSPRKPRIPLTYSQQNWDLTSFVHIYEMNIRMS